MPDIQPVQVNYAKHPIGGGYGNLHKCVKMRDCNVTFNRLTAIKVGKNDEAVLKSNVTLQAG